ncbi:MAG: hypothetical protein AAF707_02090 [Pseudomonadota bacterium]
MSVGSIAIRRLTERRAPNGNGRSPEAVGVSSSAPLGNKRPRPERKPSTRGGPFVSFALLGLVWIGARVALWESPFPLAALPIPVPAASVLVASADQIDQLPTPASGEILEQVGGPFVRVPMRAPIVRVSLGPRIASPPATELSSWLSPARQFAAQSSLGHTLLWQAAMRQSGNPSMSNRFYGAAFAATGADGVTPTGPFVPADASSTDRWSLDAWGFWRQGSNAAPISQGRVPTYGASQVGANLQYRVAPGSGHDPRLFARAYRAMVDNGETEFAAGASARPLPKVPVRVAAELRVTESAFGTDLRPAAYAFTELPQLRLPAGFVAEGYAQGGYVGGDNATAFADGQATIMREFLRFPSDAKRPFRLSLGGGAWGGAQEGASRVDVGPSMRLDMAIGEVPARVSLDWRERVGGDAAPDSGVAATLSTRF